MLSDDSSHIWHVTITNLQSVGVEDLVQLGSLREVFKHKGTKSSADVRCKVLVFFFYILQAESMKFSSTQRVCMYTILCATG